MSTADRPYVLAIGDSLTAGYGLPLAASFAAGLEALLRETLPHAKVQNAGVSGDTTEGALKRLPRLLSALPRRPDLVIVELGANDLFRGVPPARTATNLDAILLELGRCGLRVLLTSFDLPPFLAARYDDLYGRVALRHGARVAPFFPPGVLGQPGLVLADGIHPNARAIERVAAGLLPIVLELLEAERVVAA